MQSSKIILALDVGRKRIGVARADSAVGMAYPLITIANDQNIFTEITTLLAENQAEVLVVGLPRSLGGKDTEQTSYTQEFIGKLKEFVTIPVHCQDESLTSVLASQELEEKNHEYQKGDVDKLAATYILQDFLDQNPEVK